MYTHGDTYSPRSAQVRTRSRQEPPAGRTGQVDAQVAALFERVNQLESTVRRLDTTVTDLEVEVRELRRQASGQLVRHSPEQHQFKTEAGTQTRWFPGAAPKSGSALRAARAGHVAIYPGDDLNA